MAFEKGGLWRNWVGNQSCISRYKASPESEAQLCEMVAEADAADLPVRVAGSGHSFTPVVGTTGLRLSLEKMKGVLAVEGEHVTVAAGTCIGDVGRALKALGLSLANQGDIDSQAIAGAFTTGTHGTGITLGCLASQIAGLRLVQPNGEVLAVDGSDPDMLLASRVSLGTLGVISAITLKTVPAYNLHEHLWRDDFETCMERHDQLAAEHRHFGFFWCPVPESRHLYCLADTADAPLSTTKATSDVCEMKVMDITDRLPMEAPFEKIAYSSDVYPIEYVPNFHELEYAVPLEHGKEAVRAVRELMLNKHTNCIYPIEYRFTAGDEAWMSPFHRQDSITLSVSGGPGVDYWDYLRDVDAILRRYDSRPHWGKLHFLDTDDVTHLYPRAGDFRALRRRLDPAGRFLNDHVRMLLG
ncbi:D-arabinono-1,4-lactone oxidase [Antarcticirhabdus aurantiaca]|uniref:FAD-binding protein n=1 Tax=Antarcticirhabdus aurantiaca TaxID=2606717 RepID=A0ACD4NP50_9HYPH|nr:D-arabinono-1,4-lactone oxidase [Antarcticirhabdus aurantiaca]WAJ28537.1 FAD-binding protein [Jeongeuplla avenae]